MITWNVVQTVYFPCYLFLCKCLHWSHWIYLSWGCDCVVFGKDSEHLPEQFLYFLALDKILWSIINGSCFESCLKFEVSLVRRKAFLSLDWLQGYSCTIVQGGSLKCPRWGVPHILKFFKMDNWTSSASALNNIGRRNNYVSLKFE